MNKKFSKLLLTMIIVICVWGGKNTYAMELELKEPTKQYKEWLNLAEEEREKTVEPSRYSIEIEQTNIEKVRSIANLRLMGDNSSFDLRENISIILKDQKQTSQCWAFAMTTALETNVALNQKRDVEYSPRHMDYATSRTFLDGTNTLGFNREVGTSILGGGGTRYIATAYITSGRGPVLEKDMPFVNSEEKISLSEIEGKEVQLKINSTIEFPNVLKEKVDGKIKYTNANGEEYTESEIATFRNRVKEHIVKYGGVLAATCSGNKVYFSNYKETEENSWISSKAYNCDGEDKADHQVTIIGWDDNYAVSNFNEEHRPSKPGAYIVQNSYGNKVVDANGTELTVFDEGYLHISYEDFLIEQQLFGIMETTEVDYDNIYQHNPCGWNDALEIKSDYLYLANKFKKSSEKEYLTEISVEAMKGDKFEVYVNPEDGDLTAEKLIKIKNEETIEKDGYYTIKFEKPIELIGDEFVVCIKGQANEDGKVSFKIESKKLFEFNDPFSIVNSNLNESFYSTNMNQWIDFKEVEVLGTENINLTIKAFTKDELGENEVFTPEITITSDKYKFDEENKTCRISPNTKASIFKQNIKTSGNINLNDSNGNSIADSNLIGTGAVIRLSETNYYTIIVNGDVNGDGEITITDIICLKRDIIGINKLNGVYQSAGDINSTNSITSTDLLRIKQHIIGILSI